MSDTTISLIARSVLATVIAGTAALIAAGLSDSPPEGLALGTAVIVQVLTLAAGIFGGEKVTLPTPADPEPEPGDDPLDGLDPEEGLD